MTDNNSKKIYLINKIRFKKMIPNNNNNRRKSSQMKKRHLFNLSLLS